MAGELKVRHQLCAVDWEQLLDRFQFDDQAILDHQVNPQRAIHNGLSDPLDLDRNRVPSCLCELRVLCVLVVQFGTLVTGLRRPR